MIKVLKSFGLTALLLLGATGVEAQEKIETTICADFVNEYIWRGQHLGDVAVQPTLGVAYKGLSLSAWGSYGIANAADTKELDLTLGYSVGGLNIGITDYWTNSPEERYFLPITQAMSLRQTWAMTLVPYPCSGSPTLLETMG